MENSRIYTDLASEARELHPELSGIIEEKETIGNVTVSRISVESKEAAEKIGKQCGRFITIDVPLLAERDTNAFHEATEQLSKELSSLIGNLSPSATVLFCGLGNRYITPDSFGSRVAEKVFVTRQITEYMPDALGSPLRAVCAVAPGVLGVTGVETYDIIKGLTEKLSPDLVIIADALASRRAARISTTIQLTDTGISPGSGVGNARADLSRETLGVPIIALGVPTVVYATTIAQDTISLIAQKTGLHNDEERLLSLADEVIKENIGPMVVTPKDIDNIINDMAGVVADGINHALHGERYNDLAEVLS